MGCLFTEPGCFPLPFLPLTALAGRCEHPRSAHLDVTGLRDVSGGFVSQQTAIYPEQLASRFADTVSELFAGGPGRTISLPDVISSLPAKRFLNPPFASQDGGGVFSQPDWSLPAKGSLDFPSSHYSVFSGPAPARQGPILGRAGNAPLFQASGGSHAAAIRYVGFRPRVHLKFLGTSLRPAVLSPRLDSSVFHS